MRTAALNVSALDLPAALGCTVRMIFTKQLRWISLLSSLFVMAPKKETAK
jgi:hypothetical protein